MGLETISILELTNRYSGTTNIAAIIYLLRHAPVAQRCGYCPILREGIKEW